MAINVSGAPKNLINTLSRKDRAIAKFIHLQESEEDLSIQRIGQELITNTVPKSIFARSIVDLCDNAFREIFENIIVYLGPKFVGEKLYREAYSCKLKKGLENDVATPAANLLKDKNKDSKILMPVKAAIAVSALAIPLAEYSLSYIKNVFTLKVFKQADFNNIANLNKDKKEYLEHQQKVKDSAKNHIKLAGALFGGCLAFAGLLVTKGKDSTKLNHISEAILAPGSKFFGKDQVLETLLKKHFSIEVRNKNGKTFENLEAFFNKYFGLDFNSKYVVEKDGSIKKKLSISNGQITACVTAGFFGYTGAAKDRGKQDYKEIMYRFPLVGFYAISGNELLVKGFHKYAKNSSKFKEIYDAQMLNGGKMPKLQDLEKFAIMSAQAKGDASEVAIKAEYKKMFNQKAMLIGAPAVFGFTVMGMFVAACSRYFTQYRYNKDLENSSRTNNQKYNIDDFAAKK